MTASSAHAPADAGRPVVMGTRAGRLTRAAQQIDRASAWPHISPNGRALRALLKPAAFRAGPDLTKLPPDRLPGRRGVRLRPGFGTSLAA